MIKSYSKINLFLKVLKKNSNGLHNTQSNVMLLDLHDKIQSIDVPFVPVQKWFQLVVMINGRNVDIFVDKLLVILFSISFNRVEFDSEL